MRLPAVLLLAAIAATIIATLPAGAAPPPPVAGPKNPSFEAGFTWWTVTVPAGASATIVAGQVRSGGGSKFARLKTDGPGGGASVDQTFAGTAGSVVTGFARFNDGESGFDCPGFNDVATVTIDGNPVFMADSCTTGGTGGVVWTYTLAFTGDHTIHGDVQNGGDSSFDSTLDMDAPVIYKLSP
jgi:hypothetical protein